MASIVGDGDGDVHDVDVDRFGKRGAVVRVVHLTTAGDEVRDQAHLVLRDRRSGVPITFERRNCHRAHLPAVYEEQRRTRHPAAPLPRATASGRRQHLHPPVKRFAFAERVCCCGGAAVCPGHAGRPNRKPTPARARTNATCKRILMALARVRGCQRASADRRPYNGDVILNALARQALRGPDACQPVVDMHELDAVDEVWTAIARAIWPAGPATASRQVPQPRVNSHRQRPPPASRAAASRRNRPQTRRRQSRAQAPGNVPRGHAPCVKIETASAAQIQEIGHRKQRADAPGA